jgi:hypothetical protein
MTATLAVLLALAAPAPDLPADPFQRTATRALRGDFGKLQPWQRDAYTRGLAQGATADRRAWLTAYYGTAPDGKIDRYGNPCTWRTAAARDEQVPRRAYIWTPQSGIRQVLDTGAKSNIRRAKARGACTWIDAWVPSRKHNTWGAVVTPLAVITRSD